MKPIPLAMPIKVWYKPLSKLPKTFWPIIDIKLSCKGKVLPQPIFALIDSGSSLREKGGLKGKIIMIQLLGLS